MAGQLPLVHVGAKRFRQGKGPRKRARRFTGAPKYSGFARGPAGYAALGESKFHDIDVNDAIITQGANILNGGTVNIIPQGVTEVQRLGRKCTITSINWRYTLSLPETSGVANPSPAEKLRLIFYVDKQCNGATALAADILETAIGATAVNSFRNLANSGRFLILMDKTVAINYAAMAGDSATVDKVSQAGVLRHGTFYKSCSIPLEFNSTLGVLTETRSNNLGVMVVGQNGTGGLTSSLRLRFSG